MSEGVEVYEGDGHCPAIDAIIKREEMVAARERAIDAREKAVAERERQVAEREARNPEAMQKIMELIEALKQRQQGGINDNDRLYPWKHEPARWPVNPGINDVPFYGPGGTVYRSDDKCGPLLSSPPNSGTVGPLPASGGGTIVSTHTVTTPTFGSAGLAQEDRETMSKLRDLLNQVCGIGGVQINASLPAASAPIKAGNFLAKILGKESP